MNERYTTIKKLFSDNNCSLLTTFDEFKILEEEFIKNKKAKKLHTSNDNIKVNFIASCGHQNTVHIVSFKYRKTGILCKACNRKNVSKQLLKFNETSVNYMTNIEAKSIQLLGNFLTDKCELKRTCEGCKFDATIKYNEDLNNEYIPLQIKATLKKSKHGFYSFNKTQKDYKDGLLICICIEEQKIWIIPFSEITPVKTLNISSNKSKYDKYFINDNNNIESTIMGYKSKCKLNTYEYFNIPNNYLQRKEQEYVKKREQYITFIDFIHLIVQNTKTDFIINGKNVQEKVVGYIKNRHAMSINISLHNGGGKHKYRTYKLGENDFYWFNSQIDDRFWIVPENVMFDKGFISDKDDIKNRTSIYLKLNKDLEYTTNIWLKDYEYDYKKIDKESIVKIFS
jgi:hypothetical protein